jgi:hypothetical protein
LNPALPQVANEPTLAGCASPRFIHTFIIDHSHLLDEVTVFGSRLIAFSSRF